MPSIRVHTSLLGRSKLAALALLLTLGGIPVHSTRYRLVTIAQLQHWQSQWHPANCDVVWCFNP